MEDFWLGSWKGLLLSTATDEKRKKSIKKIVDSLCKVAEPSNKTLLEVRVIPVNNCDLRKLQH